MDKHNKQQKNKNKNQQKPAALPVNTIAPADAVSGTTGTVAPARKLAAPAVKKK